MAQARVSAGGGLAAIRYSFKMGKKAGGLLRLYRRMRSRNTCKTCALGMGGQKRGMVNEVGHFPEVCKKSLQAQAYDMVGPITERMLREYPLVRLTRLSPRQLEGLGRISFPMIAEEGDSHFRPIAWEEALDRAAKSFRQADPQETFFYSSGRASNEAAFLMQLMARAYGSSNIHNCSYYCHSASGVGLNKVYGSGTASVVLEDLGKADLVMIAGANPASNHPRLMTQLMKLRRRGGKVVIINPLRELGLLRFRVPSDWRSLIFGSKVSDLYLQPHVGTDVALFKAILKGVIEAGGEDNTFLENYTEGWGALKEDIQTTPWQEPLEICGISREEIKQCCQMILRAKRGIFCWAMGLTHQINSVDNILALSNLALSQGWLGQPGCGLLPIRGHSNVQGVASVGMTPRLKEAFAKKMEEVFGINTPKNGGQDTYASMEAASSGKIQAAFLLGGNLYSSNPDLNWASRALKKIPLTVYVSTKLNEGHLHGRGQTTLILPALARDEERQSTTQESMFNFVRLSDGGEKAVSGKMRSEVEIIGGLAQRILPPDRYDFSKLRSHQHLREAMAKVVPGFQALEDIDKTKQEFQIKGRTFHEPKFARPDGKAQFHVVANPPPLIKDGEFRLMTLRSEGQFNTVVYDEEDLYRGNTSRDVVMMALEDCRRLGLKEGDSVWVQTEVSRLKVRVAVVEIKEGNLAMYYPEANALVPRRIDPVSKTPAFKSVAARILH